MYFSTQPGIVFADETNGQWKVFSIKNSLTFDQDLSNAKKLLKATDTSKLVYDFISGLQLLIVQHGNVDSSILPLKDNQAFNLKKNTFVSMADFQAKMQELKNSKGSNSQNQLVQMGGMGVINTGSTTQSHSYTLPISVLAVVAAGTIYWVARKRKNLQA